MPATLPCDAQARILSNLYLNSVPNNHTLLCCLASSVSAGLEVEGALVLQPPAVSSYATDLLAIVVWWWIGQGRRRGVNSMALDTVEEARVLLSGC